MKAEEYRENITLHLTRISGDVEHIKSAVSKIEKHLDRLNGRVRSNENKISMIFGVGAVCAVLFSGCLTYLLVSI